MLVVGLVPRLALLVLHAVLRALVGTFLGAFLAGSLTSFSTTSGCLFAGISTRATASRLVGGRFWNTGTNTGYVTGVFGGPANGHTVDCRWGRSTVAFAVSFGSVAGNHGGIVESTSWGRRRRQVISS